MKTPQRNFVVEYKSARRRTVKPPASIWGSTDFKALVRDAEAAHLSGDEQQSEALTQNDGTSGSAPHVALAESTAAGVDQTLSFDSIDVARSGVNQAAAVPAVSGIPETVEIKSGQHAETLPTRRRKTAAKRSVDIADMAVSRLSAEVGPEAFSDVALALLEAENKQLKRLLFRRLHDQNLQLQVMLSRFGSGEPL